MATAQEDAEKIAKLKKYIHQNEPGLVDLYKSKFPGNYSDVPSFIESQVALSKELLTATMQVFNLPITSDEELEAQARKSVFSTMQQLYNNDEALIRQMLEETPAHQLAVIVFNLTEASDRRTIEDNEAMLADILAEDGHASSATMQLALGKANQIAMESNLFNDY